MNNAKQLTLAVFFWLLIYIDTLMYTSLKYPPSLFAIFTWPCACGPIRPPMILFFIQQSSRDANMELISRQYKAIRAHITAALSLSSCVLRMEMEMNGKIPNLITLFIASSVPVLMACWVGWRNIVLNKNVVRLFGILHTPSRRQKLLHLFLMVCN